MQPKEHWENVYSTQPSNSVSWFQEHADLSLRLIRGTRVAANKPIIDVGGGASTLVDDLLTHGYQNVTVLDLSAIALRASQRQLGTRASLVRWLQADVTRTKLIARTYDVWHDRAMFHFLTVPEDRKAYVRAVSRAVKLGGHVIVATFAKDGPTECSGLPVGRYCADELNTEFGDRFALLSSHQEEHRTPSGSVQQFVYCHFRMIR